MPLSVSALAVRAVIGFVAGAAVVAVVLWFALPGGPVPIHVRWTSNTTDAQRAALEQRFHLTNGEVTEGTTRAYQLADTSTDNIRSLVQNPNVDDTADLNRLKFRPRFSNDRARQIPFFSVLGGLAGAAFALFRAWRGPAAAAART